MSEIFYPAETDMTGKARQALQVLHFRLRMAAFKAHLKISVI